MEALNLPRGSVRAILAIVLAIGAIPVAILAPSAGQTFYAGLAVLALQGYFHSRAEQNRQDGPSVGRAYVNGGE